MMRVVIENGGSDWLTPLTAPLVVVVGGLVNWAAERRLADKRVARESQFAKDQPGRADAAVRRCGRAHAAVVELLEHAVPAATNWYSQATPELLALAAERLQRAEGRS
jgi:hypothetical protein